MTRRRGLGSGLGGLIVAGEAAPASGLRDVPVGAILANPHQPRSQFDEPALEELASSIREHGLLQPLVVAELPSGDYQLIAGERRWRAARLAGLNTVPVVVKQASPQQQLEWALIENIQRADLGAVEEARAYRTLAEEFGLTHEGIAQRVGKSRSWVTQMLGLLRLPDSVQELVSGGTLALGHVRPLLALRDAEAQERAARTIVERGLTARQAEALVGQWRDGRADHDSLPPEQSPQEPDRNAAMVEALQQALGVRVELRGAGSRGTLVLHWESEAALETLCQRLLAS